MLVSYWDRVASKYLCWAPYFWSGLLWLVFFLTPSRSPTWYVIMDAAMAVVVVTSAVTTIAINGTPRDQIVWSLIGQFSVLLSVFASAYWSLGTKANFSAPLDRVDAIYFAAGTLSTAGTGSLAPTSDLSRGLQTSQMLLGMVLVLAGIGIWLSRRN